MIFLYKKECIYVLKLFVNIEGQKYYYIIIIKYYYTSENQIIICKSLLVYYFIRNQNKSGAGAE